ncbi:MAG: T9SS type A sorting domain-containing protein, partial [Muribaculaceae bacterium]|nr:T9SS type A sorting domain-containing protein [Muribaculaceae bacterium]
IIVIDKSNDPTYGNSAGCSTRVMCELAKHYGCSNMVNFDAGGSAMMYLNGEIINRTTEGTPRSVSNGMLCYSIAPKDDKVARLAFDDITLQAPPYSTFQPRIIAYNQYDDVISYDFHGFELSCDAALGTCDGEYFVAGGNATTLPLTATYEGISVSKDMTIVDANIAIRIHNLLIDSAKEYPIEVTAAIGPNTYNYNPAAIEWTVEDPSIVSIDAAGVLKGLAEGTTKVTGKIGTYVDEMNVTVEIASSKYMPLTDNEGWKLTNTGITNSSMDQEGTVKYTFGVNSRSGSALKLAKSVPFYSIPDNIWLTFESTVPVEEIVTDIREAGNTRANNVTLTNDGASFVANKEYRIEVPLTQIVADPKDLINYPLTLNTINFKFPKDNTLTGTAQALKLKALEGEYATNTGVEAVTLPQAQAYAMVYPNPVTDGIVTVSASSYINQVAIYSVSGALMGRYPVSDRQVTLNVGSLASGVYIVAVHTTDGVKTTRLIVK